MFVRDKTWDTIVLSFGDKMSLRARLNKESEVNAVAPQLEGLYVLGVLLEVAFSVSA